MKTAKLGCADRGHNHDNPKTLFRKHYSAASKAQLVLQSLKEDKTLAQLTAQHGVHPNQISQWRGAALGALPTFFEREDHSIVAEKEAKQQQQVAELYEQIGRLTTQLAWIKKDYAKIW